MGDFKDMLDRLADKRNELARRAIKKAARTAFDSTGKVVGRILFGNLDDEPKTPPEEKPDPFAKLKAAEAERKEQERRERDEKKRSRG